MHSTLHRWVLQKCDLGCKGMEGVGGDVLGQSFVDERSECTQPSSGGYHRIANGRLQKQLWMKPKAGLVASSA